MKVDVGSWGVLRCLLLAVVIASLLCVLLYGRELGIAKDLILPLSLPRIRDIQLSNDAKVLFAAQQAQGSRTRTYDWTVERRKIAPDGVLREMITVNGLFPGPTIEANVGDTIIVNVHNRLRQRTSQPERERFSTQIHKALPPHIEAHVALHWHGISMRGSVDQDGAHSFTSSTIEPGGQHTYSFVLRDDDAGTHWWHSHVGMSRSDGLWGALIVHSQRETNILLDKANMTYEQEALLAFGDHYHKPGAEQLSWFMSTYSLGFEPTPESSLLNGRNRFEKRRAVAPGTVCNEYAGSNSHVVLSRGKRSRLRMVNTGAVGNQYVSIDQHSMTVIEADGVLVEPFKVRRLPVAPGQRYSVLIDEPNLRSSNNRYWIRTTLDHKCFNMPNPALNLTTLGILTYKDMMTSSHHDGLELRKKGFSLPATPPETLAWPSVDEPESGVTSAGGVGCQDVHHSALHPLMSERTAPYIDFDKSTAAQRILLYAKMPKLSEHGLSPMGYINQSSWRSHDGVLLQDYLHSKRPDTGNRMVIEVPKVRDEAQIVEVVIHNGDDGPHPFHLHGHKFWVMETAQTRYAQSLYRDEGQWRSYNLSSAALRDTVSVPRKGYAVLRWRADNPGVWAFHCHVLVHMVSGMAMAFVDQPESIPLSKIRAK